MKKQWIVGAVAALAISMTASANAADGSINASTLAAMGLGDAVIVTDAEASQVRGEGYAKAYGGSLAAVLDGGLSLNLGGGSLAGELAGSLNVYDAKGKYSASGENFSEAGRTYTNRKVVNNGGVRKSVTRTKSVSVYAGGFSSSMSF